MAVQSKVYVAASFDDGASPARRMHAPGSTASAADMDADGASPAAASAPNSPSARRYQSTVKYGASSSHIDCMLSQWSNQPARRSWAGSLRQPWWLFRRHVLRPVQRKYRTLSWTTRATVSAATSLVAVLYVLFAVPFRIGFLYYPFDSADAWTPELRTLLAIDLVVDAVGLVEFADFYRVWRDAFAQLSQSVAFELGKKLARDARAKSPKLLQPRARRTSLTRRQSSTSQWTLNTITPSATSSVAAASKNYREKRFQLALEVLAVLPLEVLPLATGQLNALHVVRLTKLCRVYRLRQCLGRLAKIHSESAWVQQLSYTGIAGLVQRVGLGVVLAHWFACGYMLVAHAQCGVGFERCRVVDRPTSWVVRDQLLGGSLARKYARALYWASRTMVLLGYDDVTPVSDAETVYAIGVQVVGALLSTSILAMFQFIFRYRNSRRAAFSAHVDNARAYMKAQNIPRAVRRQVMDYFSYAWATHHGLDSEAALRLMPRHLQSKVVYTLKASRVKQVCFLMKQSKNPATTSTMFRKKVADEKDAPEEMISAAMPVAPPRERVTYGLDDFDLLATLGTGTFGRVRLVRLRDAGSFHALKILKKSEILRLQQLHHIKCEVEILSKIDHPFIVSYLGHFQDERRLYLVLEYVQGGELFSYLRRQGRFADHNPFGIYQKILNGKVDFPKHIDSKAKDLIKKLLSQDRTKRLGCLRGGSEDVKKHKYFARVDWEAVLSRAETPPYLPHVGGPGDHQNFDEYPDSPMDDSAVLFGDDKAAFEVFDHF
ncbi:hypothetical protein PybrP1_007905 [[Pythium] brassicae (nom. inval.)]|nr:hypothetical protein PybrP1_007905 [[Pythium] brassicae (nom. inval.)]